MLPIINLSNPEYTGEKTLTEIAQEILRGTRRRWLFPPLKKTSLAHFFP